MILGKRVGYRLGWDSREQKRLIVKTSPVCPVSSLPDITPRPAQRGEVGHGLTGRSPELDR
jgi:hypothetical protein